MGDAVSLSELVGFSYSLCELIYPKYNAICAEIEWAIMKRVDDGCMAKNEENDEVDVDRVDGSQEIIPEAEAYIRQLYLCLKVRKWCLLMNVYCLDTLDVGNSVCMGVCVFAYWCLHCFMEIV